MSKNVAGKFFNIFVVAVVVIAVVGLWDVADAKALPSEGNQPFAQCLALLLYSN